MSSSGYLLDPDWLRIYSICPSIIFIQFFPSDQFDPACDLPIRRDLVSQQLRGANYADASAGDYCLSTMLVVSTGP